MSVYLIDISVQFTILVAKITNLSINITEMPLKITR